MSNDYKDICRSIEKLEKAISKLPKEFKDNKDVVRMLEKHLREFQKSNKFEIQKEIGNSKQFRLTLILSIISIETVCLAASIAACDSTCFVSIFLPKKYSATKATSNITSMTIRIVKNVLTFRSSKK